MDSTQQSPDPGAVSDDTAAHVLAYMSIVDKVSKFSDQELADQVIEKIWGQLAFGSLKDALLDELLRRFETRAGILRDEDGEIIQKS
jgi:hypothetical protein